MRSRECNGWCKGQSEENVQSDNCRKLRTLKKIKNLVLKNTKISVKKVLKNCVKILVLKNSKNIVLKKF